MSTLLALIVDDDANFAHSLELLVKREGFATRVAGSLAEARTRLAEEKPDVLLLDMHLPDGDGLEFARAECVQLGAAVIVITGHASIDSAVNALRDGALDYLTKPVDRARLKATLINVARTRRLQAELSDLRGELRNLGHFGAMVGRSPAMQAVYDLIARVAPTGATVMVTGESGTGKELVAETVHRLSARKEAPLLPLNCGAVSPNLIESELFGHERGSFTGAERMRKGYFERVSMGTLFLDEITEMPIELQVKLLRVLETGTVVRVGGTEPIQVDVRVIAATNRSPEEAIKDGRLREDLFYRLNVFPIHLPPLRDREGDVELLAEFFLEQLNRQAKAPKTWSRAAIERLCAHRWTGNVRELRNLVQRAFILAGPEIGAESIPPPEARVEARSEPSGDSLLQVRVGSSIEEVERRLILATLHEVGDDKSAAAQILGISVKTLYNRLNLYSAARAEP